MDLNYNHIGRYERGGQLLGGSTLQEWRSHSSSFPALSAQAQSRCRARMPQCRGGQDVRERPDALGVTTDYLLGGSEDNSVRADLEDQELLEDKKRSVKDFLEAYLFRERVREDIA